MTNLPEIIEKEIKKGVAVFDSKVFAIPYAGMKYKELAELLAKKAYEEGVAEEKHQQEIRDEKNLWLT